MCGSLTSRAVGHFLCALACISAFSGASHAQTVVDATSQQLRRDLPQATHNSSRWRLVHVPSPTAGAPLPALLQVADFSHSDPGFIGMMIRCSVTHDAGNLITTFVVAEPFPPRAQPQVTLRSHGENIKMTADVIPPGASISIPLGIETQTARTWNDASDLTVLISYQHTTLHGIIDLSGLSRGLRDLASACDAMKRG